MPLKVAAPFRAVVIVADTLDELDETLEASRSRERGARIYANSLSRSSRSFPPLSLVLYLMVLSFPFVTQSALAFFPSPSSSTLTSAPESIK